LFCVGVKISLSQYGKKVLQTEGISEQGCKGEEVTGAWRKLRNLDFDNSHLPIIIIFSSIPVAARSKAWVCGLSPNWI
jgi:hypothetical protein